MSKASKDTVTHDPVYRKHIVLLDPMRFLSINVFFFNSFQAIADFEWNPKSIISSKLFSHTAVSRGKTIEPSKQNHPSSAQRSSASRWCAAWAAWGIGVNPFGCSGVRSWLASKTTGFRTRGRACSSSSSSISRSTNLLPLAELMSIGFGRENIDWPDLNKWFPSIEGMMNF
jgi:hypothetical protein